MDFGLRLLVFLATTFSAAAQCSTPLYLTASSGSFWIDPSQYRNNVNCYWYIQPIAAVAGATYIRVTFSSFSTEICCDELNYYNGSTASGYPTRVYSGTRTPTPITSYNTAVSFSFTTDTTVTDAGFSAFFEVVSTAGSACVAPLNLTASSGPIVISEADYLEDGDCYWHIQPSAAIAGQTYITVTFTWFDTEECCDHLQYFNGTDLSAPDGEYWGSETPLPIVSYNTAVTFRFFSENSQRGTGFSAYYQLGVIGTSSSTSTGGRNGTFLFTATTGTFSLSQAEYADDMLCYWYIQPADAVEGETYIRVSFDYFDTEDCCDFVYFYNASSASEPYTGSYGGSLSPFVLTSYASGVTFRFTSDSSVGGGGFNARYELLSIASSGIVSTTGSTSTGSTGVTSSNGATTGGVTGCTYLFTSTAGAFGLSPAEYLDYTDCYWYIQPAAAVENETYIRVTFNQFDTEGCCDILFYYTASTAREPFDGSYSGALSPFTLTSYTTAVTFRFTSDSSIVGTGFSAHYELISIASSGLLSSTGTSSTSSSTTSSSSTGSSSGGSPACSSASILTTASGNILLPSEAYTNDVDCTWFVQPASAILGVTYIQVNFTYFNTEAGYDYLKYYDGPSTASPLRGRYSGTTVPAPITSNSTAITFRFTSDYSATGLGFFAYYSVGFRAPPPGGTTRGPVPGATTRAPAGSSSGSASGRTGYGDSGFAIDGEPWDSPAAQEAEARAERQQRAYAFGFSVPFAVVTAVVLFAFLGLSYKHDKGGAVSPVTPGDPNSRLLRAYRIVNGIHAALSIFMLITALVGLAVSHVWTEVLFTRQYSTVSQYFELRQITICAALYSFPMSCDSVPLLFARDEDPDGLFDATFAASAVVTVLLSLALPTALFAFLVNLLMAGPPAWADKVRGRARRVGPYALAMPWLCLLTSVVVWGSCLPYRYIEDQRHFYEDDGRYKVDVQISQLSAVNMIIASVVLGFVALVVARVTRRKKFAARMSRSLVAAVPDTNWLEVIGAEGRPYWYNKATGETSQTDPVALVAANARGRQYTGAPDSYPLQPYPHPAPSPQYAQQGPPLPSYYPPYPPQAQYPQPYSQPYPPFAPHGQQPPYPPYPQHAPQQYPPPAQQQQAQPPHIPVPPHDQQQAATTVAVVVTSPSPRGDPVHLQQVAPSLPASATAPPEPGQREAKHPLLLPTASTKDL